MRGEWNMEMLGILIDKLLGLFGILTKRRREQIRYIHDEVLTTLRSGLDYHLNRLQERRMWQTYQRRLLLGTLSQSCIKRNEAAFRCFTKARMWRKLAKTVTEYESTLRQLGVALRAFCTAVAADSSVLDLLRRRAAEYTVWVGNLPQSERSKYVLLEANRTQDDLITCLDYVVQGQCDKGQALAPFWERYGAELKKAMLDNGREKLLQHANALLANAISQAHALRRQLQASVDKWIAKGIVFPAAPSPAGSQPITDHDWVEPPLF
jgi:hypothetical protein